MMPFTRLYRGLMAVTAMVSGCLFGLIALVITVDILLRNGGFGNLPWALEASEYALATATFVGAPWVLYKGGHVNIDMLLRVVDARASLLLELLADLLGLLTSALFSVLAIRSALDSWATHSMVYKTLVFPEWWLYVPVVFCFLLLGLEFGRRAARAVRAGQAEPEA